jgi:signal-transduction protein with cAMP-binding, CBS, and nucleotidyltransferase domain
MSIKMLMTGAPDVAEPQETAWQAAVRMRQRAVGSLVIINDDYAAIGIITDRDLVERVIAAGKDPQVTRLADIMTPAPVTIAESQNTSQALQLMRKNFVRRLPVVDQRDVVIGLISLDDIMTAWAGDGDQIAQLLKGETPAGIAETPTSRWE